MSDTADTPRGPTAPRSMVSALAVFLFPAAVLLNSFSMTLLLLIVGIFGDPVLAADIGIVQAATLALFYAFSGNARNLILADRTSSARLLRTRLALMLPLAGGACLLSAAVGSAGAELAVVLVLRRVAEWIGEIGLACHEVDHRIPAAKRSLGLESVTLATCIGLLFGFEATLATSAIPWAFAPLIAVLGARAGVSDSSLTLRSLLPHFGSTAIIGASVYVFRVSIALLAGKVLAGTLFTAFAIGGLVPTVLGQALVPSLMLRYGAAALPLRLLLVPAAMLLAGGALAAVALANPGLLAATAHPAVFRLATGLSVAGGALMSVAVTLRARLIHSEAASEVFGPDLLANVLIATCVPFVYYVFGLQSLAGLYLLSACLSLTFLLGAGRGRGAMRDRSAARLLGLGILLVVPVFFQLGGGLFRDPAIVFDTAGQIFRLPIPVSAVALFAGIALLGNYGSATRTLTTLFFCALLLVTTALVSAHGDQQSEGAKLILLAQYLLPMFGLVLGEMYGAESSRPLFEWAALSVLAAILPLHLLASWMQGYVLPQAQVFVFSIYQHLQYFPMVVAALVAMAGISLWGSSRGARRAVTGLLLVATVHLVASVSLGALVGVMAGVATLLWAQWAVDGGRQPVIRLGLATLAVGLAYLALAQSGVLSRALNPGVPPIKEMSWQTKLAEIGTDADASDQVAAAGRIASWRHYAGGTIDSPREFLLGHSTPPDRRLFPSAHNYWLDALYNFGALAMLPLFVLLGMTGRRLWVLRGSLRSDPRLLGAAFAAAYLLLAESMVNVGMRQPYPGIITFFVWGLLIARLRAAGAPSTGATS